MEKIIKYIPITKYDDDQRMVYGWASTPDMDSDGEVITLEALQNAIPEYMKFPTLREMHQPKVAGVTRSAEIIDDERGKGLFIGAKVVSDEAWKMVKEGAYRAFSVGGRVINRIDNIIKEMQLIEVSLVDVPANPHAVVTLFKAGVSDMDRLESLKRLSFDDKIAETIRKGVIMHMEKTNDTTEEVEQSEATDEVEETLEAEATEEAQTVEATDGEAEKAESALETKLAKAMSSLEETKEEATALEKSLQTMGSDLNKVTDVVVKVADAIKGLTSRIEVLEKQPMPVKSKASYVVTKTNESAKEGDLESKKSRLAELDAIMVNKGKSFFAQMGYSEEAQKLSEEIALIEG